MSEFVRATKNDLSEIAHTHKSAFSDSHFTSYFSKSLLKNYYGHFIDDGSEIWLLKDIDSNILGFVVFGFNLNKRIGCFKSTYRTSIVSVAILNPRVTIKKVISNLYSRFFSNPKASFDEADLLVLSIAVNCKGMGVGSKLLDFASEYNKGRQISHLGLYVRTDSISSVNFYLKNNFVIAGYSGGLYYMETKL
jgi:ribosomal protein S18 acetylase RimI-like enzyme